MSVLVVEDDDDIRALVADFLQLLGCTVEAARNGLEALERLRDKAPEFILLDLAMPLMDGRQFSDTARREHLIADIPIVLMSASPERAAAGLQIRASAYLNKPFNLDQLAAVVERFRRRVTQETFS